MVAGESGNSGEGSVSALVDGVAGQTIPVPGTENLYGVACSAEGRLRADRRQPGDRPPVQPRRPGRLRRREGDQPPLGLPGTNGFGQVACGPGLAGCVSVGAALTR